MRIQLRFLIALTLALTSLLTVAIEEVDAAENYLAADAAANQLPRLHSLLISKGDDLVFEQYYNQYS